MDPDMTPTPAPTVPAHLAGGVPLGGRTIGRIGYGALQLERVDQTSATRLLRRALDLGVDHIDTASFYGDATVDRLIRGALRPYPDDLAIISKVGAKRVPATVPLAPAQRPEQLRAQVQLDLQTLGVDRLAAVNLRRVDAPPGIVATGTDVVPFDDQLAELVALRDEGLIGGIGLSNVSTAQLEQARPAGIVCVQNAYSVLDRGAEEQLERCAAYGIAWMPFFPLGSAFDRLPSPTQHPVVRRIAQDHGASPAQVGLAWILAHAPHAALIPGTRSVAHLEENLAAGSVRLSREAMAELSALAGV